MNVHRYHDGTKHQFHGFARSLGYLDWASQPNPFRSFGGARDIPLSPAPGAPRSDLGDLLRHSLGLSAWKSDGVSRWPLRVNPSSGNLHPTEAYVVCGPDSTIGSTAGVYHYAPDRHALEQRCAFPSSDFRLPTSDFLIALTSIHWREAWKYGERAFRYCQHDLGHAIAALSFAASLVGRRVRLLSDWSHRDVGALTGIDRDEDFFETEREEPACVLLVWPADRPQPSIDRAALVDAVRAGTWTGKASQLSEDHVDWSFIDEIARATEYKREGLEGREETKASHPARPASPAYPAEVILRRRSAVALDGRSAINADAFFAMLSRLLPTAASPWDAMWWDARVHLALFVHRITASRGLAPGFYMLVRHPDAVDRLRSACGRSFSWARVTDSLPLFELGRGDARRTAARVSCDQEIAADGFFSLGMIADFDRSLSEFGPSFYRNLFWESGIIGQVLYLDAEAGGARGTGIGCFYDDPVHELLGLTDHAFQSLYHFTIGMPLEDRRLTTEPGYEWEDLAGSR